MMRKCDDCDRQMICCRRAKAFRPTSSWDAGWRSVWDGSPRTLPSALRPAAHAEDVVYPKSPEPKILPVFTLPPGFEPSAGARELANRLADSGYEDLGRAVLSGEVPMLDVDDRSIVSTFAKHLQE